MKAWLRRWLLTAQLSALFWGHPPRHPLFVMRFRHLAPTRYRPAWLNSLLVTGIGTLIVYLFIIFPILNIMLAVIFFLLICCAILGGTLRGLLIAGEAARGIIIEAQSPPRMALFQIMPPGQMGIAWLLSMRSVHLSRGYRRFSLVVTLAQWCIGGIVLFFSLLVALFDGSGGLSGFIIAASPLLVVVGIGVWVFLDNLQAPMIGVVCGIWASTYGTRLMVAGAVAIGVYLTLLVMCGGVTWALSNGLTLFFVDDFGGYIPPWFYFIIPFVALLLSVALREIAMRGMWAWVCRRMNASGREVRMLWVS